MTRYATSANVQPAIPGKEKPIEWDRLDAEKRNWITKATEVRLGKVFPAKLREKILFGSFFQLSERTRNQIYATDWRETLRKMERARSA
jgi:hypothetical protein